MLIEGPVKLITFIRDMMKTVWLFSNTRLQTDQLTTIQSLPQCSFDSSVYCIGIWQSNWHAKTLYCPVMCDVDFEHSYCFNEFEGDTPLLVRSIQGGFRRYAVRKGSVRSTQKLCYIVIYADIIFYFKEVHLSSQNTTHMTYKVK